MQLYLWRTSLYKKSHISHRLYWNSLIYLGTWHGRGVNNITILKKNPKISYFYLYCRVCVPHVYCSHRHWPVVCVPCRLWSSSHIPASGLLKTEWALRHGLPPAAYSMSQLRANLTTTQTKVEVLTTPRGERKSPGSYPPQAKNKHHSRSVWAVGDSSSNWADSIN